jgi:hypothetical protein
MEARGGPGPPKPQNFPLKKKLPKKKKKKNPSSYKGCKKVAGVLTKNTKIK